MYLNLFYTGIALFQEHLQSKQIIILQRKIAVHFLYLSKNSSFSAKKLL